MRTTREKTHGPGRRVPLDGNAKARAMAYAQAYNANHKTERQHTGPITRTFMQVLHKLLWSFHNSTTGQCNPSHEAIAEKVGCARSTVALAINALEYAGALTWQQRVTQTKEHCKDLWGNITWRWKTIRTSNAYVLTDPNTRKTEAIPRKSENPTGTARQEESKKERASHGPTIGREEARLALQRIAQARAKALGVA